MEAFGKTLVEAMACGTPVVSFDAFGPKDIVTHKVTGYLASAFDANDLARGITWIVQGDTEELGRAAAQTAHTRFDKQVIANQYVTLYEELLTLHRGGFAKVRNDPALGAKSSSNNVKDVTPSRKITVNPRHA
jgi:glycosyltransferase involved in cell wall biosynthesis